MSEHMGERLSAYLDDELPARERAEVDAHLRECAACRQQLEDLAVVDAAARGLPVAAPAGYFDALPGRVRERIAARRKRRVPAWTWAAAAAVLLAVLTPLTLRERASPARSAADGPVAAPAKQAQAARSAPPAVAAVERPAAPPASAAPSSLDELGDVGRDARRRQPAREAPAPRAPEPEMAQGRLQERDAAKVSAEMAELKKEAPASKARGDQAAQKLADAREERADEQRAADSAAAAKPQEPAAPPAAAAPASAPASAPAPMVRRKAAANAAEGTLQGARDDGRTPTLGAPPPADADGGAGREGFRFNEESFEALAARPQRTAAEARAAARAFETYAQRHPGGAQADEARARAIESLAAAWRMEKSAADRDRARALGGAYLKGGGRFKDRVRAALALLSD